MQELYIYEGDKIVDKKKIKENEEVAIQKKKRDLTPKQLKILTEKDNLKKRSSSLGGYIHMLCIKNKLLFEDLGIDRANIARIIYLATYIDYNDRQENLLVYHGLNNKVIPINKGEMQNILKLSNSTLKRFLYDMKKHQLLFEVNNKFYVSTEYFSRGKNNFKTKEYTRVFINTTKSLYENCSVNQHKTLSYVFQLIPYVSWETNIICSNPMEKDISRINKLGLEDICKLLGIKTSKDNMRKFRESLRAFYIKIKGSKYYMFSYAVVNGQADYYVVNPLVIWGGSSLNKTKDIIRLCFF